MFRLGAKTSSEANDKKTKDKCLNTRTGKEGKGSGERNRSRRKNKEIKGWEEGDWKTKGGGTKGRRGEKAER